jgi:hypothetical protein
MYRKVERAMKTVFLIKTQIRLSRCEAYRYVFMVDRLTLTVLVDIT